MKNNKRYIGIDIIKILAIIFVPSLHFYLNYGFSSHPYKSYINVFEVALRWIFFTCIALFIMSTGYLQCNKKPDKTHFRKTLIYLRIYFIYCLLTAVFIHGSSNIIPNTAYYFFRFPAYFWYMSFFIGFFLLIPYLNIIVQNLEKDSFEKFLAVLVLVIALPAFVNNVPGIGGENKILYLPGWWGEFFPIMYYFIGAYFRKFEPDIKKSITVSLLIAVPIGIAVWDFYYSKGAAASFIGGGYGSLISVVLSVCIFSLLYKVQIRQMAASRILKYISGLTLYIYLGLIISDQYTGKIMQRFQVEGYYNFRLIIIEVALNFGFAFILAVMVDLCIRLIDLVYGLLVENK